MMVKKSWLLMTIQENDKWYDMRLAEDGTLFWRNKAEVYLNDKVEKVDYALVKTEQCYYALIEIINSMSELRQFIARITRDSKEIEEFNEVRILNGHRRVTLQWVNNIEVDRYSCLRINDRRVEVETWEDEDGPSEYFFI